MAEDRITVKEFLSRQPGEGAVESDPYYLDVANKLLRMTREKQLLKRFPDSVVKRAVLGMTDYYQDVVADAGIWRGFVEECRRLYDRNIPFFKTGDEYVDYELNLADVRFLLWYFIAMNAEDFRLLDPMDKEIETAAAEWFELLEEHYDDAPVCERFLQWRELEGDSVNEGKELYNLSNWIFLHCWLTVPALGLTLSEIFHSIPDDKRDDITVLHDRLEQSMMEDPTGPLALFVGEWIDLLLKGSIRETPKEPAKGEHPYYTAFTNATGGKIIKFFDSYKDLNDFFINSLGWAAGEEHLPMLKNSHDFILMVNREKGMLLAKDISRCIACPDNKAYDKEYASKHAIELLTVRGKCPADLLKYVCENEWLPDAVFPGSHDTALVADNYDFIARCYLQLFYRGD